MTEDQAAHYLAAFIDGEGHVRTGKNRSVSISNTEWDLIEAAVECCLVLGVSYRISKIRGRPEKNKRGGWELFIRGKRRSISDANVNKNRSIHGS